METITVVALCEGGDKAITLGTDTVENFEAIRDYTRASSGKMFAGAFSIIGQTEALFMVFLNE